MRSFDKSPKTPSRFTRLSHLMQIKRDNCIGASGREYSKDELDLLIIEKKMKKAAESVALADKHLFARADRLQNPEPCPFEAELQKSDALLRWHRVASFNNIHNEPRTLELARRKYFTICQY